MVPVALTAALAVAAPARAQCPDVSKNGASGSYTSDQLYTAVRHGTDAGGDLDLSDCSGVPGAGWVTSQPDYTFRLTGNEAKRRRLQFRVDGTCDTVLLVNTPAGRWRFDDDGAGSLDPKVDIEAAGNGIYDIWVGTSGQENCRATLFTETFNNSAAIADRATRRENTRASVKRSE